MASQNPILSNGYESSEPIPSISLTPDFYFNAQDHHLGCESRPDNTEQKPSPAPLGVLSRLEGRDFTGIGFNTIFRPESSETPTKFPHPIKGLKAEKETDNTLELNLTKETLSFSKALGSVPNRGLFKQRDVELNGLSYVQTVKDATNTTTGRGDKVKPEVIHFEPGLWMHVPATTVAPKLPRTLSRMGSIPHGTTINAQGLHPESSTEGPPPFAKLPAVDITPFLTIQSHANFVNRPFANQTVTDKHTRRLPQDLQPFIEAGTITQKILDNPNLILLNAIQDQKILDTTTFHISTKPIGPIPDNGTANIAFLTGNPDSSATEILSFHPKFAQHGPNAHAVKMDATFWIETVQDTIHVPAHKHVPGHHHGSDHLCKLVGKVKGARNPHQPEGPTFSFSDPGRDTPAKTLTVSWTQIQYVQTVFLNFMGLSWPHVSVATLVPANEVLDGCLLHE